METTLKFKLSDTLVQQSGISSPEDLQMFIYGCLMNTPFNLYQQGEDYDITVVDRKKE